MPAREQVMAPPIATRRSTAPFAGTCRRTSTSPRSAARAGRATRPTRWRSAASTRTAPRRRCTYAELQRDAEPARQRAARASACARRPRRHRHAAALRDRGRAHRGLPARRGGDAAVDAVRPRGAEYRLQRQRRAWSRSSTRARIANLLAARARLPGAATRDRGGRRRRAGRRRLGRARWRASATTSRRSTRAPTTRPC